MKAFKIAVVRSLAAMALAAGSLFPAANATVLSISPSNETVTVGDTFTLDINISGVTDLYAFQFDLGFDPLFLAALSIEESVFLSAGGPPLFIPGDIDNSDGTVDETMGSLQNDVPGVTGGGTLATITFRALMAGLSSVNLYNIILLDSNSADIAADNPSNGLVTIEARQTGVPAPSVLWLISAGLAGLFLARRKIDLAS